MRNQATSRGDNGGDRRGDYGHAQNDRWEADDYQLRSGHHYGSDQRDAGQYYEDDPRYTQQQYAAQQQGYQDEQEYDPRAYAPNPEEPYGWDDDGQPIYYEPDAREQKRGSRGGMLMVGAVLALAVIGGAGAVGYKMIGGGSSSGEPPLIKADTEPVKSTPDRSNDPAPQNKAIYDRVDPSAQKSKVVSREEEPVDLPSAPSSEPRADGSRIILPGGVPSHETTPPDTHGSEPRRVKTVAIRPEMPSEPQMSAPANDPIAEAARTGEAPRGSEFDDGILSDQGAAPAPAPRQAAAPRPAAPQPQQQSARPAPTPAPQPQQQAARPAPAPQQTAQAAAPTRPAPAPAPTQQRSDPQQVAAVAPRAAPAAPAARPATSGGGGFVVQVTSQRSEADARSAYSNLQRRYPQVLGPYQASIQSAEVADRGTYYRVRVGPFPSSNDASTVCNNLRAAGGDCVVSRN